MPRRFTSLVALLLLAGLLASCKTNTEGEGAGLGSAPRAVVGQSVGEGDACGGMAGVTCGNPGTYCRLEPAAQCGAADRMGVCAPLPEFCTKEYQPVCGCDDQTYGNACEAAAEGVSVAREGAC